MTYINNFLNFNWDNCMSGWNNWFFPTFSCNFMPSFPNFSSLFNSWEFPSFKNLNASPWFNYNEPFLFNNSLPNSFWMNSSWNDTIFSNSNINTSSFNIGDKLSIKNKKLSNFSLKDYNAQAGKRLANIALNRSVGWKSKCAKYVKTAIQQAGLGRYEYGDAYQMFGIMRRNNNFKEISPESVNVNDLPAGCVIVFNKGSQGYNPKYGHVEITTGDGRGVSDGITKNLQKPDAIFMPV